MGVTFGPAFTARAIRGAQQLSAPGHPATVAQIYEMICLESAGTWSVDVLQGRARIVPPSGPSDKRPEVAGTGGKRLTGGTGARGLVQMMPRRVKRAGMPDLLFLYAPSDPVVQLEDGLRLWLAYKGQGFKCREAIYAGNIAPARLLGGRYTSETIIYSANPEDEHLNALGNEFTQTYWPEAYRANAGAFGLDPKDPKGRLLMKHLGVGLDRAVAACRARFDAELAVAEAFATPATLHLGTVNDPDMRNPELSEVDFGKGDPPPDAA